MRRIKRVGAWYHMTGRGNERRNIFKDDRDRQHFCDLLAEIVERFRVRLHSYALMENHYHLMLELTALNLSRAGQWLNGSYVTWFNRRHGRCGHLFQGRFKAVIVSPEEWGLELSRYVHLNPVRIAAARGGFEVDITWRDGRLTSTQIANRNGGPCTLRYGGRTVNVTVGRDRAARFNGALGRVDSTAVQR